MHEPTTTNEDEAYIEIEGTVSHLKWAGDEISFYTWSLYITLTLEENWTDRIVLHHCELDSSKLEQLRSRVKDGMLEFSRGGFHAERAAIAFVGEAKENKRIKIKVLEKSLDDDIKWDSRFLNIDGITVLE